jgi:hypothetical protein
VEPTRLLNQMWIMVGAKLKGVETKVAFAGSGSRLTNPDRNLDRYPIKAKDQIHFPKFVPHARFDYFPDVMEVRRFLRISGPLPISKIPSRLAIPKHTFCGCGIKRSHRGIYPVGRRIQASAQERGGRAEDRRDN